MLFVFQSFIGDWLFLDNEMAVCLRKSFTV